MKNWSRGFVKKVEEQTIVKPRHESNIGKGDVAKQLKEGIMLKESLIHAEYGIVNAESFDISLLETPGSH